MGVSSPALEKCIRELTKRGTNQGGYMRMHTLAGALRDTGCKLSTQDLDRIQNHLAAKGIRIVDELPARSTVAADGRQRRRYRVADRVRPAPGRPAEALCPEEAIDTLLLAAERGLFCERVLVRTIRACRLSQVEVAELLEYLFIKGLDLFDLDAFLWEFPRRWKVESIAGATEEDGECGDAYNSPGCALRGPAHGLSYEMHRAKTGERQTLRHVWD